MNQNNQIPYIIFLTGASGAGKTTLVEQLKNKLSNSAILLHFDNIGVPTEEKMIKEYGSPSEWQRAMTNIWVDKIIHEHSDKELVILEGQVNLDFISSAFNNVNLTHYQTILMHCDNKVRHKRLHHDRSQPELVNEDMDNWSQFLKRQAETMDVPIIDTTTLSKDQVLIEFSKISEIVIT